MIRDSLLRWCTSSFQHWTTTGWFIDSLNFRIDGSLTHWLLDSLPHWFVIGWFVVSLTHWIVQSLVHEITDSLLHWIIELANHCFFDSLICGFIEVIHWFIDSLVHRFIPSVLRSFSCALILSCHIIGSSTAICSFVDAPHNFNAALFLHRKNFPIGHRFPIAMCFFRNFRPGAFRALPDIYIYID